jgi:hypothetical protein
MSKQKIDSNSYVEPLEELTQESPGILGVPQGRKQTKLKAEQIFAKV